MGYQTRADEGNGKRGTVPSRTLACLVLLWSVSFLSLCSFAPMQNRCCGQPPTRPAAQLPKKKRTYTPSPKSVPRRYQVDDACAEDGRRARRNKKMTGPIPIEFPGGPPLFTSHDTDEGTERWAEQERVAIARCINDRGGLPTPAKRNESI